MTFLVASFGIVWLLVTIYVVFITQRQRGLERDLQTIEELLTERSKATRK